MKKYIFLTICTVLISLISLRIMSLLSNSENNNKLLKPRSTSSPKASVEMKKARWEYFNRMLRDPQTLEIPIGIRQKELAFAKKILSKNNTLNKTSLVNDLGWQEAGPYDVGGRTRALAVDIKNSNTILTGGASGGIWKSTDKGNSWQLKSSTTQILSVTSLAQDPRVGHTNTWYYGSGEVNSSTSDIVRTHRFTGDGIYKSIDNGETWKVLQSTLSTNTIGWDSFFDYVLKVEISPVSGSIIVCTFGQGIFRSTDGGNSFSFILGGLDEHLFSDISITKDGSMIAVVSTGFPGVTSKNSPGVYKSSDDGATWINITPSTFPQTHNRSVIEIAPSNKNIAYVLTFAGPNQNIQYEDIRFHKIIISSGSSEDRSNNLPNFQNFQSEERINSQNGYNLTLAIKPDNENFVLIAGTSLFKSTDGFATKPTDPKLNWIGGYHPQYFMYPNFHPDIHSYFFDPNNSNAVWWGHDGGLSYTSDITNTNFQDAFPWENKNNGYNVTQFFSMAISKNAGDNRIMGGSQDNGTPHFVWDGSSSGASYDVSLGDGGNCYYGTDFAFVGRQLGQISRVSYDQNGNPNSIINSPHKNVPPTSATGHLFINPYEVDPNNENILYYPAGNEFWRNDQIGNIPNDNQPTTTQGWSKLDNLSLPAAYKISALAISESNPNHRLYYGASEYSLQPTGTPKLFRLDNANSATSGAIDISIAGVAASSFINNISINPENANELIVVFSNYNIMGVYHSTNAGQTFTSIEGNIEGDANSPGPSVRAAAILPTSNGTQYFLATSTGVYSTTQLNGGNTNWILEGANTMGNVIVNSLAARKSDGRIVAGTHGRGAFVASVGDEGSGTAIATTNVNSITLQSNPGQSGSTNFVLSNSGDAPLNYSVSVTGSFNDALSKTVNNSFIMFNSNSKENVSQKFKERKFLPNSSIMDVNIIPTDDYSESSSPLGIEGNDILFLDDGDNSADDFFGWLSSSDDIYWYNEFNVTNNDFSLEAITFYMRTDSAIFNGINVVLYDQNSNYLIGDSFSLDLSPKGQWYTIPLSSSINFKDGESFYISLGSFSGIMQPIGLDLDATIPNNSYYSGDGINYQNLNTISGAENSAFLIRAIGTLSGGSGGGNKVPVAIANVSKTQVEVNETISFDANQSSDSDGQITQYLWNFGDGSTSTQKTATHSYTQANTYNYSLTVTDDKGATGQTSGQIIVSDPSKNLVTVTPPSGTIASGGSQTITISLDAQNINEGTYTGQVNIITNGGNIIIPIDYLVDVEKISSLPTDFSLSQNYPNPFNPTTTIKYSIPAGNENIRPIQLSVYDVLGNEVATLVNKEQASGSYAVQFDASKLSSGLYFYRLEANDYSETKKMLLIK